MRAIEIVKQLRPDIDPEEGLRVIEDMEIEDTGGSGGAAGGEGAAGESAAGALGDCDFGDAAAADGRLEAAGLPVPERIISADMVERGKPDPEPYRRGAELLGLRPEECVVVEDAPSGVGAGMAAGCRVLGVLGTAFCGGPGGSYWIVPSLEAVTISTGADSLELRFSTGV